jgi:serpin B
MMTACKSPVLRPGLGLLLCAALLGACSDAQPSPGQEAGTGGQVAGSGAGQGGRSGSPAAGAGGASGSAGLAADGGRAGTVAGGGAQVERSLLAADDTPDISDADYATFLQSFTKFGLDLGQAFVSAETMTDKNVVYSPLSAAFALAMSYAGARGETAAEMKTVLGDSFAVGTFHSGANRLARALTARETSQVDGNGKTRKVELNLAAAHFLERTLAVQPAFLDLLATQYDSGVQRVDFVNAHEAARLTINDWVAAQTQDKILDLIPMGKVDRDTPFVLVNALYFYGSWHIPFTHEATSPADFHTLSGETLQVDTMRSYGTRFNYASAADYSLAELLYVGNELSMVIVLPAQDKFESVRGAVDAAWLAQTVSSLEPTLLNVSLPKFKLTVGSFSLRAGLEALGMKQAFTNAADFSGLAPGVRIGEVLQKCFIAVDEDGTEAAAATAVIGAPTSANVDEPIPFIVDRPFLFFIRDSSGAVLFSGQVVDPS